MDLEKFIKQFEIGQRREFGQYLIERGFLNISKVNLDSTKDSLAYIETKNFRIERLDLYENHLLEKSCKNNLE